MTPTAIPNLTAIADPRLLRALRLLAVRAAQPADEGADRAVVRAAARRLRGAG